MTEALARLAAALVNHPRGPSYPSEGPPEDAEDTLFREWETGIAWRWVSTEEWLVDLEDDGTVGWIVGQLLRMTPPRLVAVENGNNVDVLVRLDLHDGRRTTREFHAPTLGEAGTLALLHVWGP